MTLLSANRKNKFISSIKNFLLNNKQMTEFEITQIDAAIHRYYKQFFLQKKMKTDFGLNPTCGTPQTLKNNLKINLQ